MLLPSSHALPLHRGGGEGEKIKIWFALTLQGSLARRTLPQLVYALYTGYTLYIYFLDSHGV
jgi:hypothetical protein